MEELVKGSSLVTTFTIPDSPKNVHTIGKPHQVDIRTDHLKRTLPSTATGAECYTSSDVHRAWDVWHTR